LLHTLIKFRAVNAPSNIEFLFFYRNKILLNSTGLGISGMIGLSIPSLVLAQGHTVLYGIFFTAAAAASQF